MNIDLDAIHRRHAVDAVVYASTPTVPLPTAHVDRGALLEEVDRLWAENCDLASSSAGWAGRVPELLNEVDRLTAELAEAHRTIDSLCRSVGRTSGGAA